MEYCRSKQAARPVPLQADLRKLPATPAQLKRLPNWVCWRWEWRLDKKSVGKWTKPPFQPNYPRRYAKNNDPSTWGTYDQALAVLEAGDCDGIGFNLSGTHIAAFDLDNCRDARTGAIAPEAMAIVNRAASYTEITVSGTGLHVLGYGSGAKMHRKQTLPNSAVQVESYRNAERYIVITGNPQPRTCPNMADIDGAIDAVVAKLGERDSTDEANDRQDSKDDGGQDDEFAFRTQARNADDAFLPYDLVQLIECGVPPDQDLSAAFHHVVCRLGHYGWSATRIETLLIGKPIVPDRFARRLRAEIDRSLHKAKIKSGSDTGSKTTDQGAQETDQSTQGQGQGAQQTQASPFELFWHGKEYNRALRSWLVKELIPETGQGLASGQWGTGKTFGMIDLAASVMTATPFAGREISRRGGVLFIAAEGASEIPIRLQGVVDQKLRPAAVASGVSGPISEDLERLPFAWIEECPDLQDNGNFNQLVVAVKQAAQIIRDQFDLPLALIVIDTLTAAGNFKDANDAAEGQFIMRRLGELSRQTGAFVLAVDHFGKAVETGTRGTSAKEAAADVVLALLAEREINGIISDTRMALRKLRGGKVGIETPFDLRVVDLGKNGTTCIVEWKADRQPTQASTATKNRWTKSLRIFQRAMTTALVEHGKPLQPYGNDGPTVRATPLSDVHREFMAIYPADASDGPEAKKNAKRMAFTRTLKQARDKELVCSREIGEIDYLWLVEPNEN